MSHLSSAEMLRSLWEQYSVNYVKKLRHKPSKHDVSTYIVTDGNALSKWMTLGAPKNRRIPIEHIPKVAAALMLTPIESDLLMKSRLRELIADDPSFAATVKWVSETTKLKMARRYALDDQEKAVLAAFRKARESFPRGLYGDGEEKTSLDAYMHVLLERAEELHAGEALIDDGVDTVALRDRGLAFVAKEKRSAANPFAAAKKRAREA